jgi:CheY-like chemotaxis protein
MYLHTAPGAPALSQSAVEVTIREQYLLRSKTNIARTLILYSLDNGPWHETDDARFIFRFTAFDWMNNLQELLHREHIHCDAVRHFDMNDEPAAKKIVIAGGEDSFLHELTSGLEALGYAVKFYASGKAATERLSASTDLFIVDRHCRDIDGLQLCRHLRAHPLTRKVPILLLSAEAKKSHEALLAGATDCVVKPCHIHYLLNVVARYAKRK